MNSLTVKASRGTDRNIPAQLSPILFRSPCDDRRVGIRGTGYSLPTLTQDDLRFVVWQAALGVLTFSCKVRS